MTYEMIPDDLRNFLNQMLIDADMTLDETTRRDMLVEFHLQLDNYMTSVIVENLSSKQLEKFTRMAERGAQKPELEAYLAKHIPDSNMVFAQAMVDFRNLYLGNVARVRSSS